MRCSISTSLSQEKKPEKAGINSPTHTHTHYAMHVACSSFRPSPTPARPPSSPRPRRNPAIPHSATMHPRASPSRTSRSLYATPLRCHPIKHYPFLPPSYGGACPNNPIGTFFSVSLNVHLSNHAVQRAHNGSTCAVHRFASAYSSTKKTGINSAS